MRKSGPRSRTWNALLETSDAMPVLARHRNDAIEQIAPPGARLCRLRNIRGRQARGSTSSTPRQRDSAEDRAPSQFPLVFGNALPVPLTILVQKTARFGPRSWYETFNRKASFRYKFSSYTQFMPLPSHWFPVQVLVIILVPKTVGIIKRFELKVSIFD